ncbi:MAG TPA: LCP family protein [Candidatus Dormibacteraeota bacterium]|nr:LCP family protein [Candidatus Dormibacteraeota bacterium]
MNRPGIAALLSALWPGLGQAWLGARRRALLVALPMFGLVAAVAAVALLNVRLLIDGFVQPGTLEAILVGVLVLAVYHLLAVRDAFRVGVRRGGPDASGRTPILLLALALVVGLYGSVELVGVHAYEATSTIFVNPGTGFTIPSASFAPTDEPGSALGTTPSPSPEPSATALPVPAWAADGRLNLLLIGSDAGPGRWSLRTDTMIVLSVDIATHRAAMFGIPRNIVNVPLAPEDQDAFPNGRFPQFLNALYVYAMGHANQFPGGDARGFRAVTGAVQELVGVPLDGAIVVDLNGFVDLVNAVGGLWINIPQRLYDAHYPKPDGSGYIQISIPPGCQQLNGDRALEYARSRHQDDDYARMRRQQAVLLALRHELNPIALLPRVPQLLDIAKNNLWTTIQPGDIADLAALAAHVDSHDIQTIELSPPTYPEFLNTEEIKAIQKRVQTIFAAVPSAAASPSPMPSATPKPCPQTP